MNFAINGIALAALIFGIVEAAKEFGVEGQWSRVLALALGFGFVALAQAIEADMIGSQAMAWVNLFVTALAGALAANGYYDFGKKARKR